MSSLGRREAGRTLGHWLKSSSSAPGRFIGVQGTPDRGRSDRLMNRQ
jgi:hypothetical protein